MILLRVSVILLALATATAGCLGGGDAPRPGPPAFVFIDPISTDHNHSDPALHALATPTMRLIRHDALNPDGPDPRGLYGEADVQGDLAVVAVTGMAGETPGFVTLDVSDRSAPRVLAFAASPNTGRLADVKLTPHARWLFAAAQSGTQPRPPPAAEAVSNANFWSSQNGLRVYDLADPAAPKLTQTLPSATGYGCHMVAFKTIGSGDWLFCVGRSIEVYSFDKATGQVTFRSSFAPQDGKGIQNIPANDRSNPQGFVTETRLSVTPHDMTVQDDPVTGAPIMVVSWWDLGVRVVDVSNPLAAREIGAWSGEGAGTFEGNVHTAMAALVDGKRVIVAIPELLRNDPAAVWVLDATDYAAMKLVGEWVVPGRHGADGIRFSTHNFQVANDRMVMAFYHAGVWILDLKAIAAGGPLDETGAVAAVLGYYLPHADVRPVTPPESTSVPNVWDVVLTEGHVYAIDIPTGLYVLQYAGDTLGDATATGFA